MNSSIGWKGMTAEIRLILPLLVIFLGCEAFGSDNQPLQDSRPQFDAKAAYRQYCHKCHGPDGAGANGRKTFADIPDFTKRPWHNSRSNAQLLASILEGRGAVMPSFRNKLDEAQARAMVDHVRGFNPPMKPTTNENLEKAEPQDLEESFRRLNEELDQLQSEFREASEASDPETVEILPPMPMASDSPVPKKPEPVPIAEVFQQHCAKCHGADGKGTQGRELLPKVPDFTDPDWQAKRTDERIKSSILNGKGEEMPASRGKITEKQAEELVTHIRGFSRKTQNQSIPEKSQSSYSSWIGEDQEQMEVISNETRPPRAFLERFVMWLAKFHPVVVHFPFALLAAAAGAELLRWTTGKSDFYLVSRFCIWIATIAALMAATLGWFAGTMPLHDDTWVMYIHRWLGTSTFACSAVTVALCELSRRSDHLALQVGFRLALLFTAGLTLFTGFLGGAVSFGLSHYC
jgi:mono/diheme cytochrome c family protein/uncharacterized membrane protein